MDLTLRDFTLRDTRDLAAALNNPKIQANLRDGIPCPYREEDAVQYIQEVLEAPEGSQYVRAIVVDGQVAGCIGAFRKDNIHLRTAELGYYLAEQYWGRGLMTRVLEEFSSWLLRETDLVRLFAEPFATNQGSCRVLEKAGFTLEGVMRSNAIKDGRVLDMRLYAKIRE